MSTTLQGQPCWFDLYTSDTEEARRFYASVFGWVGAEASEAFGGYFMFFLDEAQTVPVAGCMPNDDAEGGACWQTYLNVDNIDAVVTRSLAAGAVLEVPITQVADLGFMAGVIDPTGAFIGLWQPVAFAGQTAYGPDASPGMTCYSELHTRDFAAALRFYRDAIGWDPEERKEMPDLEYATLGGGNAPAGIMGAEAFLAEGETPSWLMYFATADADETADRVRAAGGSVISPPQDTPFGRIARIADPSGAKFQVMGPNRG